MSLYSHGLVGFGALVAVMLSTAGDEAFIMLAMIPETALLIFLICFVLGIVGGFLAEKIVKKIKLKRAKPCPIEIHPGEENGSRHFLIEHVYKHVIKKHVPKLFLWIFFTLLMVGFLVQNFDLAAMLPENMLLVLILSALVGIIPESGPHLIFLIMFAEGLIPLLSYSLRDTIHVKLFNVAFGLSVGVVLFLIGI